MSLSGFLNRVTANRVTARQAEDAGTAAPACQAFPEIIESHPLPCVRPAVVRVQISCPCGHAGIRLSCEECAEPGPRQVCGNCADEYRHKCPMTLRRLPLF